MRGGIEKPPPSIMPCYTAIHSTTFQEPASHVIIELNETPYARKRMAFYYTFSSKESYQETSPSALYQGTRNPEAPPLPLKTDEVVT